MKIRMQSLGLRVGVLLCGAGLAVTAAKAQDMPPPPADGQQQQGPLPGGPRGGMDPGMRAARLQKALGLTDEVTAQVKAILVDGATKMQAMRASGSGSREDMMALRQGENAKVKALLTPDQATKLDEMEARMRERGRGKGGPPPDGGGTPPPQQ